MKRLVLSLALSALLAGCASPDVKEQPGAAVEERKPDVATAVKPPPPSAQVQKVAPLEIKPAEIKPTVSDPLKDPALKDPNNILSKRSVYFDYDSSIVKDEFRPLVTAHGRYLAEHRSVRLVVQGNTDERGSREYNIALGQRRADSVKQMMVLLGAQEAQIESVSFGEEKPRGVGKDEESYAQNRRSDIVYQGE